MFSIPDILGLWTLPLAAEVCFLALLVWNLLVHGAEHGFHYSFEAVVTDGDGEAKMQHKSTTPSWFPELHWTDRRAHWGAYLLAVLAGCDLVRVAACWMVGQLLMQLMIDYGATGRPFTEPSIYRERNADGSWQRIEKTIYGRRRLWLAAAGLPAFFYAPFLRALLRAISLDGLLAVILPILSCS